MVNAYAPNLNCSIMFSESFKYLNGSIYDKGGNRFQ